MESVILSKLKQSASELKRPLLDEADEENQIPVDDYHVRHDWYPPQNLDHFFILLYRYWQSQGYTVLILDNSLNLLALGFTFTLSTLLVWFVDWPKIDRACLLDVTCDLSSVITTRHALSGGFSFLAVLEAAQIIFLSGFWIFAAVRLLRDIVQYWDIAYFCRHKLGIRDRELRSLTWPDMVARVVKLQRICRLCIIRDHNEHDIMARLMRRDNYLIAMINKQTLPLSLTTLVPKLVPQKDATQPQKRHIDGSSLYFPSFCEFMLRWAVVDAMFDHNFQIKREFRSDWRIVANRLRMVGALMLMVSPFSCFHILLLKFLRNAERMYNHPSNIARRTWCHVAKWQFRQYNEAPHLLRQRLVAASDHADVYLGQFRTPAVNTMGKFVAFVAGSFAALLILVAFIDNGMLQIQLYGKSLMWWGATLGVILAVAHALSPPQPRVFEPRVALHRLTAYTHYMPKSWRSAAHTEETLGAVKALYKYHILIFVEDILSTILTPLLFIFILPPHAPHLCSFLRDNTTHIPGLGDLCTHAQFDFERHGNVKYGSPVPGPKRLRSRQGKVEKSALAFLAMYPTWRAPWGVRQLAKNVVGEGDVEVSVSGGSMGGVTENSGLIGVGVVGSHGETGGGGGDDDDVGGVRVKEIVARFERGGESIEGGHSTGSGGNSAGNANVNVSVNGRSSGISGGCVEGGKCGQQSQASVGRGSVSGCSSSGGSSIGLLVPSVHGSATLPGFVASQTQRGASQASSFVNLTNNQSYYQLTTPALHVPCHVSYSHLLADSLQQQQQPNNQFQQQQSQHQQQQQHQHAPVQQYQQQQQQHVQMQPMAASGVSNTSNTYLHSHPVHSLMQTRHSQRGGNFLPAPAVPSIASSASHHHQQAAGSMVRYDLYGGLAGTLVGGGSAQGGWSEILAGMQQGRQGAQAEHSLARWHFNSNGGMFLGGGRNAYAGGEGGMWGEEGGLSNEEAELSVASRQIMMQSFYEACESNSGR